MKQVYSLSLTCLLLLTGLSLSAQNKLIQVGLKGGLNLASLQVADPAIPSGRTKWGLNLGATVSYKLNAGWFLQSGLSLTSKGMKLTGTSSLGFGEQFIMPGREASLVSQQWYVQAPLYLGYGLPLGSTLKLILQAGPYMAYGVGGKTKVTGDIVYGDVIYYSTWAEPTFGERGLKRMDVGLATGVGLEMGRSTLGLNYELGFRNIAPDQVAYIPFYATSQKNRMLSLSIQYRL